MDRKVITHWNDEKCRWEWVYEDTGLPIPGDSFQELSGKEENQCSI